MNKNSHNTFDQKCLNINKEIDEQIGKIKNSQMIYPLARISKKLPEDKNKGNRSKQKKSNSSVVESNERKIISQKNSHIIYNNNMSIDNKKNSKNGSENVNIYRTKIYKKNKFDRVERVVIDLVNNEENDTFKTESIANSNIYVNEYKDKYNNKSNEYNNDDISNKDNNISNSLNTMTNAINKIESRWRNQCVLKKEEDLSLISNEITKKKREIEVILKRWKDNKKIKIINEDKLSIFSNNNILNKWKINSKNKKEININFPIDEDKIKEKEIKKIQNRWKNNNTKIINTEKLSFLIDNLKIKEKEINKILNRWKNNNIKISKNDKLSFLIDNLKIKEKEMNNFIKRWLNYNKSTYVENISFPIDQLKIKKKEIEKNKIRWNNNIKNIKLGNFSYLVEISKINEKNIQNNINRWKNECKINNKQNISYIIDINELKEKEEQKNINNWNNSNEKENKISLSYETKLDLDVNIFKYSQTKYIADLIENIYISDNNKENFFILNYDNIDDSNKINYQIIKPKNKSELQSILYNYYNENKNDIQKGGDLNKDNNLFQMVINKNARLNPIFILNDKQIKQLYEEFNSKKIWKDELIISNQIDIGFEVIEPYLQTLSNKNNEIILEKIDEFKLDGQKKIYKDFGETTPFSMLNDKFYIFAVSRYTKYLVQSPQPNINYINNNKNNNILRSKKANIFENIKINHFSLWIEKIDKSESSRSLEMKETSDKK